mgnify:CR=1 FL=1
MWRRVTKNYAVRIDGRPGERVIVTLRHGGSIVKFSARVFIQGGYTYVIIPKPVREAYGIRPHDEVEILSISANNSAIRFPFSVSITL